MSPADFRGPLFMDDLLSRLQDMNISSAFPQYSSSDAPSLTLSNDSSTRSLDGPFSISMSFRYPSKESDQDFPTVIDTFAPKPFAHDLSPPSSASSERGSTSPPYTSNQKTVLDAFNGTRSRVVRLSNLPLMAQSFLSALFLPQNYPTLGHVPTPVSLWTLKESGPSVDCVWAVFQTHEEARAVLSLSGPAMSVTGVVESDLEPYHKLQAFKLRRTGDLSHVAESQVPTPSNLHHSSLPSTQPSSQYILPHVNRQFTLRSPSSYPDLRFVGQSPDGTMPMQKHDYTISSNPPNPRSNFRIGDWICSSPKCAAHNFGRNLVCIGCGCPRTNNSVTPLQYPIPNQLGVRTVLSPRFASQTSYSPQPVPGYQYPTSPSCTTPSPSTPLGTLQKPSQPLLTPSGRAFAIGGRVRNISNDPLSPCIMYWPDNEPLPEQGQIRPGGIVGLNHPPILNTGNRGPISHQPGDWICKKCNYLNWRRRKVCQTCLPYAEGNGDSISAAIQAERIALLTSVLSHNQLSDGSTNSGSPLPVIRSHSSTPPNARHPRRPTETSGLLPNSVHRSHSQLELAAQYTSHNSRPIYQTSGHRQPSPLYTTGPEFNQGHQVLAPAPLLPSFLQDIVQSPTLSPSSSSSADLSSLEEDTNVVQDVSGEKRQGGSPSVNIWRLGIEESKSYNVLALQNRQHLVSGARNVPMHHVR